MGNQAACRAINISTASGEARLILPLGTCLGSRNTWGSQNIFKGTTRSKLLFHCHFVVCGDLTVISGWSLAPWSQATPLPRASPMLELQGCTAKPGSKVFQHSTNMQCAFLMLLLHKCAGTVSGGLGARKDVSSEGCWDACVSLWWTTLLLCSTDRRNLLQMGASWDLKNF